MDGRPNRGRGGSWKRGGRGGNDSDRFGGEHRGRGRGGQQRGRGRREHHRGHGRGGGAHAAQSLHRNQGGGDCFQEEDDRTEFFSRRKLESNWERYKESEAQEPDNDLPTHRGTDYHVLLESAGDSFTHFRFSEEKDWEMDSFTVSQMSAVFVDLPALAQRLQQVPLHQRLNLEAELVQVVTPAELPTMTLAPKQEIAKTFTAPPAKGLGTNKQLAVAVNPVSGSNSQVSSKAPQLPVDDGDKELDQLLSLQTPVSSTVENQSVADAAPEQEETEVIPEAEDEKMEKVKDLTPPKSASMRQEMTEEDLEDWLDSMIS